MLSFPIYEVKLGGGGGMQLGHLKAKKLLYKGELTHGGGGGAKVFLSCIQYYTAKTEVYNYFKSMLPVTPQAQGVNMSQGAYF